MLIKIRVSSPSGWTLIAITNLTNGDSSLIEYILRSKSDFKIICRYYNGGEKPVKDILIPRPELVHQVIDKFGTDPKISAMIFNKEEFNWRTFDAIHLLNRWRPLGSKLIILNLFYVYHFNFTMFNSQLIIHITTRRMNLMKPTF